MIQTRFCTLLFLLAISSLMSCGADTASSDTAAEETTTENVATESPTTTATTDSPLLIKANSYQGITPGDAIAQHQATLQKDILKTGEGNFDIYRIKATAGEAQFVGFLDPDPMDESKVGDIIIDVPEAQTEAGIQVGDTFKDLKEKVPNIEVHGSEIEGRTYAKAGQLSYRLDVANFNYEVDMDKIPATAKVMEIMINRQIK